MKNTIRIDFANNPGLRDLFTGKEPGSKCSLMLDLQITEIDEAKLEASITKIRPSAGEAKRGAVKEEVLPSDEEPVTILMRGNASGGKAQRPEAADISEY